MKEHPDQCGSERIPASRKRQAHEKSAKCEREKQSNSNGLQPNSIRNLRAMASNQKSGNHKKEKLGSVAGGFFKLFHLVLAYAHLLATLLTHLLSYLLMTGLYPKKKESSLSATSNWVTLVAISISI